VLRLERRRRRSRFLAATVDCWLAELRPESVALVDMKYGLHGEPFSGTIEGIAATLQVSGREAYHRLDALLASAASRLLYTGRPRPRRRRPG
jgi:hypothetical protein